VAKPPHIELADGTQIPILYEDRSVIAIDKPSGWMLAPDSWEHTGRNLQLALNSSLNTGDFWARSRNLKFLRFIHRLDADTSGLLLLAKSPGALRALSALFETRRVEKLYLAVVRGIPIKTDWTCNLKLAPEPSVVGRMKVNEHAGKDAETHFEVLRVGQESALVAARPTTGRTHQIRVHLAAAGHPVLGDPLYAPKNTMQSSGHPDLALRAVRLSFQDPFQQRHIRIEAPTMDFKRRFGFA